MQYQHIPIRKTKTQNTENTKCWWGYGVIGTLICDCWEYKMVYPPWKSLMVSYKLNTFLPYDQVIAFLGIYPKELTISVQTKIYTQMFIAEVLHFSYILGSSQSFFQILGLKFSPRTINEFSSVTIKVPTSAFRELQLICTRENGHK